MLIEIAEVVGPGHEINLIAGPGQVPKRQFMLRIKLVHQGFEMPVTAFGIKEEVSDETDAVPLFQFQRKSRVNRGGLHRPGRGFPIDIVARQFRILGRSLSVDFHSLGILHLGILSLTIKRTHQRAQDRPRE